MKNLFICLALFAITLSGCGGNGEIKIPTEKLTAEQEAAIKADDKKVADEESQGAKRR